MRTLFIFAIILASAVAPSSAQDVADPAACAMIAGGAERLACYDAIFPPLAGASADAVVLQSRQPIPARPTGRMPATMTVRCGEGGVEVSFVFANQLLSETSDDAAISFQVDQTGNRVRNLPVSADNVVIGFPAGRDSLDFLESIEGGRSLQVRITPVRQRSVQVLFELRASEAAIAALRESCAS